MLGQHVQFDGIASHGPAQRSAQAALGLFVEQHPSRAIQEQRRAGAELAGLLGSDVGGRTQVVANQRAQLERIELRAA